jgi:phosphatidylinositol alpha-mannosyltransferase
VRVAQVCPYSLTTPGGVQGQVLGLARALRALGHEARVLGPCDGAPPEPGVTPLGPTVPLLANGSVAPIAPGPRVALRALAAVADEGFDVIHLHEPLVPGPTLTLLAWHRAPTVGTFHRAGPSRAYQAAGPLVRWLAARLDVRCAVSPDAAATAKAALGGEYQVLFNGIELERFAKAKPYPTAGPTVLFLGRHEARKGLAHLLEAARALPAGTRLWVAGSGPESGALRRRFADLAGVEWLGAIGEAEKASRLRGAHVLCAPSLRGESFGVVLLEAMAAGCAVVASDLPAYRAVVRDGVDGLLVPPADVTALAAALRRVLEDPDLAERLAAAGEARAAEFSMDRLAERYLELYGELLAS